MPLGFVAKRLVFLYSYNRRRGMMGGYIPVLDDDLFLIDEDGDEDV